METASPSRRVRCAVAIAVMLSLGTAHAAVDGPATEAEARALLADWLAAQNEGDFAAYSALYAVQFHGIKRAKAKVTEFDRAGWLTDRRRMFKKPMQVQVSDIQVTVASPTAVRFTQVWRSGTFADKGTKVLHVTREQGKPRILREELLQSEAAPPVSSPAAVKEEPKKVPYFTLVVGEAGTDAEAKALLERFERERAILIAADVLAEDEARPGWEAGKSSARRRLIIGHCYANDLDKRRQAGLKFALPNVHVEPAGRKVWQDEKDCPLAQWQDRGNDDVGEPLSVDRPEGTITVISESRVFCCDCLVDNEPVHWTYALARSKRGVLLDQFHVEGKQFNGTWEGAPSTYECYTDYNAADGGGVELHKTCDEHRPGDARTTDMTWTLRLVDGKLKVKKRHNENK